MAVVLCSVALAAAVWAHTDQIDAYIFFPKMTQGYSRDERSSGAGERAPPISATPGSEICQVLPLLLRHW
jgi:hypothetical protein